MGVGRIFSRGGGKSGFVLGLPKCFSRGETEMKFHFNHSKLRKQPFSAENFNRKIENFKIYGGKAVSGAQGPNVHL